MAVRCAACADSFDDDLDAISATMHARYSPQMWTKCAQGARDGSQQSQKWTQLHTCDRGICAGGGTRTHTLSRAPAPKAGMSANFITPAKRHKGIAVPLNGVHYTA